VEDVDTSKEIAPSALDPDQEALAVRDADLGQAHIPAAHPAVAEDSTEEATHPTEREDLTREVRVTTRDPVVQHLIAAEVVRDRERAGAEATLLAVTARAAGLLRALTQGHPQDQSHQSASQADLSLQLRRARKDLPPPSLTPMSNHKRPQLSELTNLLNDITPSL